MLFIFWEKAMVKYIIIICGEVDYDGAMYMYIKNMP